MCISGPHPFFSFTVFYTSLILLLFISLSHTRILPAKILWVNIPLSPNVWSSVAAWLSSMIPKFYSQLATCSLEVACEETTLVVHMQDISYGRKENGNTHHPSEKVRTGTVRPEKKSKLWYYKYHGAFGNREKGSHVGFRRQNIFCFMCFAILLNLTLQTFCFIPNWIFRSLNYFRDYNVIAFVICWWWDNFILSAKFSLPFHNTIKY